MLPSLGRLKLHGGSVATEAEKRGAPDFGSDPGPGKRAKPDFAPVETVEVDPITLESLPIELRQMILPGLADRDLTWLDLCKNVARWCATTKTTCSARDWELVASDLLMLRVEYLRDFTESTLSGKELYENAQDKELVAWKQFVLKHCKFLSAVTRLYEQADKRNVYIEEWEELLRDSGADEDSALMRYTTAWLLITSARPELVESCPLIYEDRSFVDRYLSNFLTRWPRRFFYQFFEYVKEPFEGEYMFSWELLKENAHVDTRIAQFIIDNGQAEEFRLTDDEYEFPIRIDGVDYGFKYVPHRRLGTLTKLGQDLPYAMHFPSNDNNPDHDNVVFPAQNDVDSYYRTEYIPTGKYYYDKLSSTTSHGKRFTLRYLSMVEHNNLTRVDFFEGPEGQERLYRREYPYGQNESGDGSGVLTMEHYMGSKGNESLQYTEIHRGGRHRDVERIFPDY